MAASSKKTVNDVSHPSKTAAGPTSRPVIVGHGPMIEDPTLKPSEKTEEKEDKEAEKITVARRKDKVIEAPESTKAEVETEPEEPAEPEAEEPVDEPEAQITELEDAKAAKDTTDEKSEGKKSKEVEPVLTKEEQAQQAVTDKLVESKKYFLPIREAKRKRRTRMALLLLLLFIVVGIAAADLLIDAGIIKTDIPPIANLIKN